MHKGEKTNDQSGLGDVLQLVFMLMVFIAVCSVLMPSIPNLVTVRGGMFDHCTIQFAVWCGNWLNEIPPSNVPYVYIDPCCHSFCF